jgi:hypothetical protein
MFLLKLVNWEKYWAEFSKQENCVFCIVYCVQCNVHSL